MKEEENKKTAGKYYSIFLNDIVPKTHDINGKKIESVKITENFIKEQK